MEFHWNVALAQGRWHSWPFVRFTFLAVCKGTRPRCTVCMSSPMTPIQRFSAWHFWALFSYSIYTLLFTYSRQGEFKLPGCFCVAHVRNSTYVHTVIDNDICRNSTNVIGRKKEIDWCHDMIWMDKNSLTIHLNDVGDYVYHIRETLWLCCV